MKGKESLLILILLLMWPTLWGQKTEKIYLSGTGSDQTKKWEFFCTKGMKSGSWSTIPVPSCWELQGFGAYNYGHEKFDNRLNEQGLYRHSFMVPDAWKGKTINIVFEGVMTDALVTINGKTAGPKHQGAFYPFKYNISKSLKYGKENLLEVTVDKHSSNKSINEAERHADYWVFGGIFRPVYLEAHPRSHIHRVAIDAKADGQFTADIFLSSQVKSGKVRTIITSLDGNPVAKFEEPIEHPGEKIQIMGKAEGVKSWNPEFPNLYMAKIQLLASNGKVLHETSERVGFRTIEVRESDGIYVNGVKIKMKGVNHHSFYPTTGRTTSKVMSIADVNLIKDMNMNAIRMSHYPPDRHLLDVCDSLGLFVLNELAGWQTPAYDEETGKELLAEMIQRDINHPSIILWDNGNEGGWNTALDDEFAKWDIQKRIVIHPWQAFGLTNTSHYINYGYLSLDGFSRRKIFFPTEFLHGLYDGGHGAGLEDYWLRMWHHPLCAGGFLWVFADEAVVRTDHNGTLDSDGNHAPDGIVGPFHEKEGSFYTIKEIWAPIYFEESYITSAFDGTFNVENRFHFTNLNHCSLTYRWVKFPKPEEAKVGYEILQEGIIDLPSLEPLQKGRINVNLPEGWKRSDALLISGKDPHGRELFTWSWPVKTPGILNAPLLSRPSNGKIRTEDDENEIVLRVDDLEVHIEKNNGYVSQIIKGDRMIPLSHGPIEVSRGPQEVEKVSHYPQGDTSYVVEVSFVKSASKVKWVLHENGLLDLDFYYRPKNGCQYAGVTFDYPEDQVRRVKWLGDGPYRVWKNRMKGTQFNVWQKEYNNTVTGEFSETLPEFKGYYSGFYWAVLEGEEGPSFKVYSRSSDLFLRLFTPERPKGGEKNAEMHFPEGDISFLHGIPAIGTKFTSPERLGPQSQPYDFRSYHYEEGGLELKITFDFK